MAPMEDTSAADEPDMPPNSMLTSMFTIAVPPLTLPTMMLQKAISFFVISPSVITWAIMIKKGTAIKVKLIRLTDIFWNRLKYGIPR